MDSSEPDTPAVPPATEANPPVPAKKRGRPSNAELAQRRAAELAEAERFPEKMREDMRKMWSQLSEHLSKGQIKKMSPHSAFVALGILTDKLGATAPGPRVHNQTNIQINGVGREDLVAMLTGKQPVNVTPGADVLMEDRQGCLVQAQSLPARSGNSAKPGHAPSIDIQTDPKS